MSSYWMPCLGEGGRGGEVPIAASVAAHCRMREVEWRVQPTDVSKTFGRIFVKTTRRFSREDRGIHTRGSGELERKVGCCVFPTCTNYTC